MVQFQSGLSSSASRDDAHGAKALSACGSHSPISRFPGCPYHPERLRKKGWALFGLHWIYFNFEPTTHLPLFGMMLTSPQGSQERLDRECERSHLAARDCYSRAFDAPTGTAALGDRRSDILDGRRH